MTASKSLLVELLVEELPPKALKKLGEVFSDTIFQQLRDLDFLTGSSVKTSYASPRRLAVHVTEVLDQSRSSEQVLIKLPLSVAFGSDGNPSVALAKKLKENQADVSELTRVFENNKEFVVLKRTVSGGFLFVVLGAVVEVAISRLPIPKVMTYQLADGWSSVNFVRPAHGLVALYGADVVPVSVLGLQAGRETHGHRFEASVDPIVLKGADSYAVQLENEGAVIASFAARREEIVRQLGAAAAKAGGTPIEDDALLDEVTALVERPNVLIGEFEKAYLEVPQECLILTMKANQKYFPLLDASGKLTNQFLIVSNINPADPSAVIQGNERVVRPRLADAKFFFDQDRKKKLADRVAGLNKVVYHNKLGTQGERSNRVTQIALTIATLLGTKNGNLAGRAAYLAKADLLTDMVGEFPELQGIMGRYYALHDGEPVEVADAIEDHYKPRFAGDVLPRGQVGIIVALADKLETLVGLFGVGQIPTGDKDPFALRRHTLGVIRLLGEGDLSVGLRDLLDAAACHFSGVGGFDFMGATPILTDFIYDRLAGSLREQGYSAQEVDAVVSQRPQCLGDIPKRLAAVRAFAALPEAAALAAANKRVGNILKKVEGAIPSEIDENQLHETAEIALKWSLGDVQQRADIAFEAGDYTGSLKALAALRVPVDAFFNDVMVNVDDVKLRNNRLALLANLHEAMNRVADLSKLST